MHRARAIGTPSAAASSTRCCISVERDLWVLMSEVATAPENRRKLVGGEVPRDRGDGDEARAAIDDLAARTELPKEFVVPGDDHVAAAARRRAHRRAPRRARARSHGRSTARSSRLPQPAERSAVGSGAVAGGPRAPDHQGNEGGAMTLSVRIAGATELPKGLGARHPRGARRRGPAGPQGLPSEVLGRSIPTELDCVVGRGRGVRGDRPARRSRCVSIDAPTLVLLGIGEAELADAEVWRRAGAAAARAAGRAPAVVAPAPAPLDGRDARGRVCGRRGRAARRVSDRRLEDDRGPARTDASSSSCPSPCTA